MSSITGLPINCTMATEPTKRAQLEKALLEAHAVGDGQLLAQLYEQAADMSEAEGDHEGAAFYLTHALVFALQEGMPHANVLRARLHSYGREDL